MRNLKENLKIAEFNLKTATSQLKTHIDFNLSFPEFNQTVRTWDDTINGISNSIVKLEALLGVKSKLTTRSIRRHVKQSLAMPLVVWRDVEHETLAKFMEHEAELPGFGIETDVSAIILLLGL